MPAVVDPAACNRNYDLCFPAKICPNNAFSLAPDLNVVIDSSVCGECPGPCTNFCDGYAIRFDPDPASFDVLKRQTLGEITEEQAVEARIEVQAMKDEAEKATKTSQVLDVTTETFESEVLLAEGPVVVDFWAPWCGPCKQMAPVFEELAGEYAGMVRFVKVNTDEEPQLAGSMGITGLPTTIAFVNGQPVDGAVGALGKPQLQTLVSGVLAMFNAQTAAVDDTGTV